jgi:hypothetical protein
MYGLPPFFRGHSVTQIPPFFRIQGRKVAVLNVEIERTFHERASPSPAMLIRNEGRGFNVIVQAILLVISSDLSCSEGNARNAFRRHFRKTAAEFAVGANFEWPGS